MQETEGVDATSYQRYLLKARLQRDYPQLIFHQLDRKKQSELVFVDELSVGEAFEKSGETGAGQSSQSSQSETDKEMHLGSTAEIQKEVTLKEI